MNKIVTWIIVLIVIVAGFFVLSKKSEPTFSGPIKIGWIGPLTGDGATIGQNAKEATDLAVNEINVNGGINGRLVEVIYEDGKCTGKDASGAASKLINIDKVVAILGGACSGETAAFASMAEQAKIPVLSYCSSVPSLTTAGDYIFRNVPSDAHQGAFAADYIYNTLQKRKVSIIYQQTEWSSGIHDVFKERFIKDGGLIVSDESFAKDARDFKTQLSKAKAVSPELIYFIAYAEPSIPALKQIRDMGITVPLFGADAWSDPKIPQEAKLNAEGMMFTGFASHSNQAFINKMQTKTNGATISECSATAYDGMNILAEVIKKVGTSSEAVKNALYQVDYKGGAAFDEIQFDKNGDLIAAPYAVRKIVNGKAVEIN